MLRIVRSRYSRPLQRSDHPRAKARGAAARQRARVPASSFLWEWAKIFTISVVLFFGIKTFLVEAFKIPSGSMERTLLVGDFLLVNKVVYGAELPLMSKRLPGLRRADARRRDRLRVAEGPHQELREAARRIAGRHAGRCATACSSATASRSREPYVVAFRPGSRSGLGGIPVAEQLPREDRRGRRRVSSVTKQLGSVGRP